MGEYSLNMLVIWIHSSFNAWKFSCSWSSKTPSHHVLLRVKGSSLQRLFWLFAKQRLSLWLKSSILVSFIYKTFFQLLKVLSRWFLQTSTLPHDVWYLKAAFSLQPCRAGQPASVSSVLWTGEHECQHWPNCFGIP